MTDFIVNKIPIPVPHPEKRIYEGMTYLDAQFSTYAPYTNNVGVGGELVYMLAGLIIIFAVAVGIWEGMKYLWGKMGWHW